MQLLPPANACRSSSSTVHLPDDTNCKLAQISIAAAAGTMPALLLVMIEPESLLSQQR
jgi:hypothetical protein